MAWITDLTHYLNTDGRIAVMPAPAVRLAEYFGAIAAAASSGLPCGVACRRRPGHSSCPGRVAASIHPKSNDISWCCPECGDEGLIHHWEGTPWDRTLAS